MKFKYLINKNNQQEDVPIMLDPKTENREFNAPYVKTHMFGKSKENMSCG